MSLIWVKFELLERVCVEIYRGDFQTFIALGVMVASVEAQDQFDHNAQHWFHHSPY